MRNPLRMALVVAAAVPFAVLFAATVGIGIVVSMLRAAVREVKP